MVAFDLVQTVAFAGVVLFFGYGVKRVIPFLTRYNIPAPVVGGLIVSLVILIANRAQVPVPKFDTTLRDPLMIAFFTSVGFGASVSLLRVGGPLVLLFFAVSTVVAVLQSVVGWATATALGQHPLLGVLAGSVTLTGGPATGMAFAPEFAAVGVPGAETVAVAAAMVGIVAGGLMGGPIGTFLIERYTLAAAATTPPAGAADGEGKLAYQVVEDLLPDPQAAAPAGEDVEAYGLLKAIVIILIAMGIGAWVSGLLKQAGVTLPAYIGAMLVAAAIRNLDDVTGAFKLSQKLLDDLGSVSLSLFLVIALMTLDLTRLAGLAVPLAVILLAQLLMIAIIAPLIVFRFAGRDYDAAVMSSGFIGFMLGTTANAMANMEALVQRFRPSPKAFLVVPMVGAFFIDFTNAIIITFFLNFYR